MMTMYSNAQKLAAVLNKWAQPAIQGLLGTRLGQLPFIANTDGLGKSHVEHIQGDIPIARRIVILIS